MNGKGDGRRPMTITQDEWELNYARTFGNNATVAQSEERRGANAEVGGSSPLGRSEFERLLAALETDPRWGSLVEPVTYPVIRGESFVIYRPSFSTQYTRSVLTRE